MTQTSSSTSPAAGRFGTFKGVFTPNVLTILGIILFLRTGWVVGQSGLWGSLAIILGANFISFMTGLSLSAIATSMNVKAGGNYYLISRSLGLEIGGAIGIPLYLSQAISVAFYIIGFTEAISTIPFFAQIDPRLISGSVALVFIVIAWVGADFALRIQYVILAILIAALISFFTGGWGEYMQPNLTPQYTEGVNFWIVFAVFFPAVTGIEVGISLSGDLKDPSRSIPRGTIASILVTSLVYVAAAVWFAYHLSAEDLIANNMAMEEIASLPFLILAGVAASTLSSALGSVLAAPRTLQAISKDRVTPLWMSANLGSETEPRMAVLITGVVAIGIILLGDLNFVAPIITMFFLNTYGMVNLVAAIERLVGNPSYRPTFRIPLVISALGAVGCYGAMFLINTPATIIAIIFSYGIFFLLSRRRMLRSWGDVRSGIWTSLARYALLNLEKQPREHDRNWRPNLMVFTGQPHNREQLVALSEWLSLGRGIVTFFQLITAPGDKLSRPKLRETAERHIRTYIRDRRMAAFAEAQVVQDFRSGVMSVAQAHGVGRLESNAILLGWSGTPGGRVKLMQVLSDMASLEKSVLFLRVHPERGFGSRRVINVWWKGAGNNAELMLILSHLIRLHADWDDSELRLSRIIDSAEGTERTRNHMREMLELVHVDATVNVIVRSRERPFVDVMQENSLDVDLTVLGMQLPSGDEIRTYGERLEHLSSVFGSVLMVHNARDEGGLLDMA